MFENVTYTYYSDVLGRAVIPNETEFDKYTLFNKQWVKRNAAYITEREENGIDAAVCLMCEIDYQADTGAGSPAAVVSSETVSGHSVSYDVTQKTKESELDAKSKAAKKIDVLKLYCYLDIGV